MKKYNYVYGARKISEYLVGRKILSLIISNDKTYLGLMTDKGMEWLYTNGDCCSHSWIENITGVKEVIGNTIFRIKQTYLPDIHPIRGDAEHVQAYSFKIYTDNLGVLEIEFRNSSNGYYSGMMELVDEGPDVFEVKPLTRDF